MAAALLAGAGILASEQFGLAERCLEMTVGYVKERHQFARPVGGFQAIKHRLADLWVAVTQARAAARAAANALTAVSAAWQRDDRAVAEDLVAEAELAVALAKAACSDTALKAAQETDPAARRHRVHLGAPGAPVPQAGQGRLDRLRHRRCAPGHAGEPGEPAASRTVGPSCFTRLQTKISIRCRNVVVLGAAVHVRPQPFGTFGVPRGI